MASYTDRQLRKFQESGQAAGITAPSLAGLPQDVISVIHSEQFFFAKAADDGAAATTTAETFSAVYFPRAVKINAVTYVAATGGITADNANFATVNVNVRDSTGVASPNTIATLTTTITSSGNIVQGAPKDLVLVAANVFVAARSTVTFSIAKSGTGVVVRAGTFNIDAEYV